MPEYELTTSAANDLEAIADYTVVTWGVDQAERYEALLVNHFKAIGQSTAHSRVFLRHRPNLRFSRCEHHYVFYLMRENTCPLIVAVFHERMDLMTRFQERLSSDELDELDRDAGDDE